LTPIGRSFIPVIAEIRKWGARHLNREKLSMAS
jgi:DNA-binding HxlR family transcriptional regulator